MKSKVYFRLNFISPPFEGLKPDEKSEALSLVRLWCASELKMPLDMVKAISSEKIEEVKD